MGPAGFELNGPFLEPSERLYNPHAFVSISGSHVPCVHVVADLVCGLTLEPAAPHTNEGSFDIYSMRSTFALDWSRSADATNGSARSI